MIINGKIKYGAGSYEDIQFATVNRVVKRNGQLVMGAGNAKACAEAYPSAPRTFAKYLHKNRATVLECDGRLLGALVTKDHFKDKSDLGKVIAAITDLHDLALEYDEYTLHVPYPAIGLGGLTREQLDPYVLALPDNVLVYV